MKRKHRRTLDQIASANPGTDWSDVKALLRHLAEDAVEAEGSAVTFFFTDAALTVHRPHPRRECGQGLVRRVRSFLQTTGHLK
ncbi:MAG: hypothetical protein KY453_11925 [Gemmatimonadetes bacterium]|nr:hypothetical protein [Gemmatimonadota bacterium]